MGIFLTRAAITAHSTCSSVPLLQLNSCPLIYVPYAATVQIPGMIFKRLSLPYSPPQLDLWALTAQSCDTDTSSTPNVCEEKCWLCLTWAQGGSVWARIQRLLAVQFSHAADDEERNQPEHKRVRDRTLLLASGCIRAMQGKKFGEINLQQHYILPRRENKQKISKLRSRIWINAEWRPGCANQGSTHDCWWNHLTKGLLRHILLLGLFLWLTMLAALSRTKHSVASLNFFDFLQHNKHESRVNIWRVRRVI